MSAENRETGLDTLAARALDQRGVVGQREAIGPPAPLDDLDSRPGSSTSLVRTIIGAALRASGGWMPTAQLVSLARAAGLGEGTARSAIARVRTAGLLLSESRAGVSGHALNPAALALLEGGDRRIFDYRQMRATDGWCLVSFTIPESHRAVRHQLRRRLAWIGCGTVAPALWVCPESLAGEVRTILDELRLSPAEATVFTGAVPATAELSLAEAAVRWWDLPSIRTLHETFLNVTDADAHTLRVGITHEATADPCRDEKLFRIWIHTLDAWRTIPYLDPGLPAQALPADWPGAASLARFTALRERSENGALRFALG